MKRPFLDDWITRCCGLDVLSEESLRRHQLNKINEVLRYTERNSLLYRKRLAGVFERHGEAIRAGMWPASPDDVTQLPFTTARDLEDGWKRFVCVPLDAIARMVTLSTSGTTGEPKRLAFASADLERTLVFQPTASACWCVPAIRCSFYCPERNAPMGLRIWSSGHCPGSEPRGVAGNPAAEQRLLPGTGAASPGLSGRRAGAVAPSFGCTSGLPGIPGHFVERGTFAARFGRSACPRLAL